MIDASQRISRRALNAIIFNVTAWPFVPSGFLTNAIPSQQATSLQKMSLSFFENPDRARAFGQACLMTLTPPERSYEKLDAFIRAELGQDKGIETMANGETFRIKVLRRIRDDFANGDVMRVDGWILSSTEARLYALVSLHLQIA